MTQFASDQPGIHSAEVSSKTVIVFAGFQRRVPERRGWHWSVNVKAREQETKAPACRFSLRFCYTRKRTQSTEIHYKTNPLIIPNTKIPLQACPKAPCLPNSSHHRFILSISSSHRNQVSVLAVRRRPLRRLILRPVTTIRRLRRLQLDIVVSTPVGRSVIVRRRRVVAVVIVRLLGLRRLVVVLVLRVLRILRASRVVGCLAVAWRRTAKSPAGAAVWLVAALSATAGGDTSGWGVSESEMVWCVWWLG